MTEGFHLSSLGWGAGEEGREEPLLVSESVRLGVGHVRPCLS